MRVEPLSSEQLTDETQDSMATANEEIRQMHNTRHGIRSRATRSHRFSLAPISSTFKAFMSLSLFGMMIACSPRPQAPPENVPEELVDLVPIARRWGSESNYSEIATEAEIRELCQVMRTHVTQVDAWLASFPEDELSETASDFFWMRDEYELVNVSGRCGD